MERTASWQPATASTAPSNHVGVWGGSVAQSGDVNVDAHSARADLEELDHQGVPLGDLNRIQTDFGGEEGAQLGAARPIEIVFREGQSLGADQRGLG